jgi:monofunctional biosynthetic peptidoglycan transglycosylase
VRGGSTITQQLAKNLYLSKEKSLIRKLKEFFIAKQIEEKLTKPQIIEKYLNVVEFAGGVYGIQKAAYHYFQKSPSQLTPAESAYLVSLLPNPKKYSTAFHSKKELSRFNKRRVTSILYILKVQGKISEEEYNYEVARTEIGLWTPYSPEVMFTTEDASGSVDGASPAQDPDPSIDEDADEAPDLEEDAE